MTDKQGLNFARCLKMLVLATVLSKALGEVYVISTRTNKTIERFSDYELEFSPPAPSHGVEGLVVPADPIDGCEPIKPPPDEPDNVRWFALIKRKGCTLADKINNAQQANYKAAIIYNNGVPDIDDAYNDTDPDIDIVAVLINEASGLKILNNYLYNQSARVLIKPSRTFTFDDLLLPCTIVIGACIFIMVLFMIIRCVKHRRRHMRNRLSSRHLKHLQIIKFKKGTHQRYEVCAICLDEYCDGEKLRILPCNHAYHTKCIDPWLTNSRRNCPVCKRKVVIEGVTPETDSESDGETNDHSAETTPLLVSRTITTNTRTSEGYGGMGSSQEQPVAIESGEPVEVSISGVQEGAFAGRNIFADIIHNVRRAGRRLNQGSNINNNAREAPLDNSSGSESSYGSVASLLPPQSDVNSINFTTSVEDASFVRGGPSTSRVNTANNQATLRRNEFVI